MHAEEAGLWPGFIIKTNIITPQTSITAWDPWMEDGGLGSGYSTLR